MSDTCLKSITLRNWATVREATLVFPEKGLVVVQGLNLVSKSKLRTIGSGKTSLGEAISRTLLGVPGRYSLLGSYSYKGQGNTLVVLNCTHKGKSLQVETGFKAPELNPDSEALRFTYDGQQVWRDRLANTRSDLAKILTVPADLAAWTVYLDGDSLKFSSLSQRSSVEILMAALAQPPWTDYLAKANQTVNRFKNDLRTSRDSHQHLQDDLAERNTDLEAAQASLDEAKNVYEEEAKTYQVNLAVSKARLKDSRSTISVNETKMATIKKEIDRRIGINAEKEHALEIERNSAWDKCEAAKDSRSTLKATESSAQTTLARCRKDLATLQSAPKNCPTCGKPWEEQASQASLSEAQAAVKTAQTALIVASGLTQAKGKTVNEAEAKLKEIETNLADLRAEAPVDELSQEYEDLELTNRKVYEDVANQECDVARYGKGPDKSRIIEAQTSIKERLIHLKRAQKAVDDSAAKIVEDEQALQVAVYWQEAFGPAGIPNMILRDTIGPLNETSRRISTLMTGGCIQVNYSTSRELVSGRDKAELNITVDNPDGASRVEGNSKGEASLTNLIVAETLAEVGGVAARIGYRWYDEILANQEEGARRSALAYMKEIASRYGILIFVVSHTPEAASYADYILTAVKETTGTTYRWD